MSQILNVILKIIFMSNDKVKKILYTQLQEYLDISRHFAL